MTKFFLCFIFCFLSFNVHAETTRFVIEGTENYFHILSKYKQKEAIQLFNDNTSKMRIITDCTLVIGTHASSSQGNDTYGGICTIVTKIRNSVIKERSDEVMICSDVMMGRLKMQAWGYAPLDEIEKRKYDVAKFVIDNCYSG